MVQHLKFGSSSGVEKQCFLKGHMPGNVASGMSYAARHTPAHTEWPAMLKTNFPSQTDRPMMSNHHTESMVDGLVLGCRPRCHSGRPASIKAWLAIRHNQARLDVAHAQMLQASSVPRTAT